MRSERQSATTVVRLAGEFDLGSVDRFEEELREVLGADTRMFVLDLRGLEFIDSTGLRVLLQIDALARADGFEFSVVCGDGQVRRVLRETGLDGVLPLVDRMGSVPPSDSPL